MKRLDELEAQSVYILREAYKHFRSLCMLWSIGKDSTVMLWLTRKAFFGHVPFPLVHIDTSYKIPSMIAYRDQLAREWKLQMVVGQNRDALADGMNHTRGRMICCGALKTEALKHTLDGTLAAHAPGRGRPVSRGGRRRAVHRRDRRGAGRRGGQPLQGALLLAARREQRLGRSRSAARVLEPVQDRLRARHPRAHPPAARLDRDQHLGVHRAREGADHRPLLRQGRGQALPVARLRAVHRIGPVDARARRASSSSSCGGQNVPERAGRAQDQEDTYAMEKLRREGYM